jgi:hypothetical protein
MIDFGSVDSHGTVATLNQIAEKLRRENSLRASIGSIKNELDKSQLAVRDRQSGKTSALIEWVHKHDSGNTIIVCCNENMKAIVRSRYREMFPLDKQPIVVSIHSISDHDVRGTNRKWVTDEVWPQAVIRKARSYASAEFAGGVGTASCMDAMSDQFLDYEENEKPESPKFPVLTQNKDRVERF